MCSADISCSYHKTRDIIFNKILNDTLFGEAGDFLGGSSREAAL
jgi:hypothetical protein